MSECCSCPHSKPATDTTQVDYNIPFSDDGSCIGESRMCCMHRYAVSKRIGVGAGLAKKLHVPITTHGPDHFKSPSKCMRKRNTVYL